MTEDDPCPLKAGGEASPELVRALRALGRSNIDSARLARVAEKLGTALRNTPPPGPSSTGWKAWFGTKTLISLVLGLTVLSVFGYRTFSQQAQIAASAASVPTAKEAARTIAVVEYVPDSPLPAVDRPSAEPEPVWKPKRSPFAARSTRSAVPQPAQPTQAAQPTEPTVVAQPAAPMLEAPVASHDSPAVQPAASTEKKPVQVEAQPEPSNLDPAAPHSELELLFAARKALPTQPTAALRLLDEHASRFPKGMLAPEREVLSIEALRTLGRTSEATQRLRRFQSQFPESIHLGRLAGNPGG